MKIYNTLTRTTETISATNNTVLMYVCGLTPYAPAHVGHAMRSVVFDVLRRYLEHSNYRVKHVENFTDIDDKMITTAAARGISTEQLAEENIDRYQQEMAALNVVSAHVYPRATREIPKILEMIRYLVDKGAAYVVNGDVYYEVRQNKDYGKLSHRSLDKLKAGARIEIDENKKDAVDFALWKKEKPGEPSWDSPWGKGRPGWHIECSAMALKYLGETLDIHGGGQDLVFPHHENEIAQSETYTDGKIMARFWVHNGLLRIGTNKMSKSSGNFITIHEALQNFSSDALRLFFLSSHYRSPLTYDDDHIMGQEKAIGRIRNTLSPTTSVPGAATLDASPYRQRFFAAMDEDLNTPRAIGILFDLTHEINRKAKENANISGAQAILRELVSILGLTLTLPTTNTKQDKYSLLQELAEQFVNEMRSKDKTNIAQNLEDTIKRQDARSNCADPNVIMETLVETRSKLRSAKSYELADLIRVQLAEIGFIMEDTQRGTTWKYTGTR